MSGVKGRLRISLVATGLSLGAAVALPAVAFAQGVTSPSTVAPAPDPVTTPTTGATGATGPAGAKAPVPQKTGRLPAHMSVVVHGIHKDGKVRVGKPVRAFGYLRPFVPDEHVRVKLMQHGRSEEHTS